MDIIGAVFMVFMMIYLANLSINIYKYKKMAENIWFF